MFLQLLPGFIRISWIGDAQRCPQRL